MRLLVVKNGHIYDPGANRDEYGNIMAENGKIIPYDESKITDDTEIIDAKGYYVFPGLIAIIILQTFTRYVIFHSLPWSEELTRFLFILVICLSFNIAISKEVLVNKTLLIVFSARAH